MLGGANLLFAQLPTISSFSPISDIPGNTLTINGTNFNSTASNNIVYFGTVKATVSSASSSQLQVTIPDGATYQPIRVINLASNLGGTSQDKFLPTWNGTSTSVSSSKFGVSTMTSTSSPSVTGLNPGNTTAFSGVRHNVGIGDFNEDGKQDICQIDYTNSKLTIFTNGYSSGSLSTSNFSTKTSYTTQTNPSEVEVIDFNGDGHLDILVSCSTSSAISVFINNYSSGTAMNFKAKTDLTVTSNFTFYKTFDANFDGKPDIAGFKGTGTSSRLYVYYNTMSSSTATPSIASTTSISLGTTIADLDFGDLNNDGKMDIVAALSNSTPYVLINSTSSSGSAPAFATKFTLSAGATTYSVKIGDINLDGNYEILFGTTNSTNLVLFQNKYSSGTISSSSFSSAMNISGVNPGTAATSIKTWSMDINDLDGDQKPDILVGIYNSSTTLPTGYMQAIQYTGSTGSSSTISTSNFTIVSNIAGSSIGKWANMMAVDFDGDNRVDILANSDTKLVILQNNVTKSATMIDAHATGDSLTAATNTYIVKWNSSTAGAILKTFTVNFSDVASTDRLSVTQTSAAANWQIAESGSSSFSNLNSGYCNSLTAGTSLTKKFDLKYTGTTAGTYITELNFQLSNGGSCTALTGSKYVFKCTCVVVADQYKTTGGTTLSSATSTQTKTTKLDVDAGDTATIKVDADATLGKLKVVAGTTLTLKSTVTGGSKIQIDTTFIVEAGAEVKVSGKDTVRFSLGKGAKAYINGPFKAASSDGKEKPKVVFDGEGEVHFSDDIDVDSNSSVKFRHTSEKHVYFDGLNQTISGGGELEFDRNCTVHFGDGSASSNQRCTATREIKCYGKVIVDKNTELASDAPDLTQNTDTAWQQWSPKIKLKNDGTNQGYIAPITTGGSITGGVLWEMYNSAVRSYRTVAFPLKNGLNLSQITDDLLISGTYSGTNKDSFTNSCSYCVSSCYKWDEPTSAWVAYKSGSTPNIVPLGQGILLFFRGMSSNGYGNPNASANAGVIGIKGEIFTGSKTITLSNSGSGTLAGYNLIGNVYPSNIDFTLLQRSNVANKFMIYDPRFKDYNVWNGGNRTGSSGFTSGPSANATIIEAGASFFAIATGTSPTITFSETSKTTLAPNVTAFKEVVKPLECNQLKMRLQYVDTTGGKVYQSQNYMEWDSRLPNVKVDFDEYDTYKMFGGYVGIGSINPNQNWMSMDYRPFATTQIQSIPLKIKTSDKTNYKFTFEGCPVDSLYNIKLVDKQTKKEFVVKDTAVYKFAVDAADSMTENRFDIVIERLFDPQFASVEEKKKSIVIGKHSIFPVPVTGGKIHICGEMLNQIELFEIVNIQGSTVLSLNNKKESIPAEIKLPKDLPVGVYYVRIKDLNGLNTQKVVIEP